MKEDTSWGDVAEWYDAMLEQGDDSYQKKVILPNMLRLLDIKKGQRILDLACGQGFFARAFFYQGAEVTGVDAGKQLIALAKKHSPKAIDFYESPADRLDFLKPHSFDAVVIILAVQNIRDINAVFAACAKTLKPHGTLFLAMNHPVFRIPKESAWGWDAKKKMQFRRIDAYMTESKSRIDMHPGKKDKQLTVSFHRPLQAYVKALAKNGFSVARLEEWISHKKSQKGPRQEAEDKARREIPLFLMLEAKKAL